MVLFDALNNSVPLSVKLRKHMRFRQLVAGLKHLPGTAATVEHNADSSLGVCRAGHHQEKPHLSISFHQMSTGISAPIRPTTVPRGLQAS